MANYDKIYDENDWGIGKLMYFHLHLNRKQRNNFANSPILMTDVNELQTHNSITRSYFICFTHINKTLNAIRSQVHFDQFLRESFRYNITNLVANELGAIISYLQ